MRAKPSFAVILIPLLTLCMGLILWVGGCDFSRVDEGVDITLEEHLQTLATATTSEAAESALRGILNKTEVGVRWRTTLTPGDYDAYTLNDAQFKALARAQAGFVNGDHSQGRSFRQVYDAVLTSDVEARELAQDQELGLSVNIRAPIQVQPEEVALIFQAAAKAALREPEAPANALLLTIAAEGTTLPASIPLLSQDHVLSPVQQFLLQIWFHRHGPFMAPFLDATTSKTSGGGNNPCCGAAPSKFTSLTLQYLGSSSATVNADIVVPSSRSVNNVFGPSVLQPNDLFTVNGLPRGNPGFDGTIGNEVALFVNAVQNTQIHTSCSVAVLPGDTYGAFKVIAVTTRSGGFCGNLQTCIGACQAQLNTCLSNALTPAQEQTCRDQYRDCDQSCHDQGGGG